MKGMRRKKSRVLPLLDLEATSASRKKQALSGTAAAAFVVTRDEIRRSGSRSIPQALRMAPGLQVEQIEADKRVAAAANDG
ncbi:MAG: hypothetical protein U1F14_16190 [Steroidobacteraceae bacterium]